MLDVSLLKDPVFMLIGISNMFGMAGLYVPFVYLVDAAKLGVSIATISFQLNCHLNWNHANRLLIEQTGYSRRISAAVTFNYWYNEYIWPCDLWLCGRFSFR